MTKPKMKQLLLFFSTSIFFLSCSGKSEAVKGKLTNSSGEMIWLQDVNTGKGVNIDSCKLSGSGEFEFHAAIPIKGFYNLTLSPGNFATLILDPKEKIFVSGDAKNLGYTYKTEGSIPSLTPMPWRTGKNFRK
jgi:hypothetical protein